MSSPPPAQLTPHAEALRPDSASGTLGDFPLTPDESKKRSLVQKLFGKKPPEPVVLDLGTVAGQQALTKNIKVKKGGQLTIIHTTGNNNTTSTSQASVGKNKGVLQQATDKSVLDAVTGGGDLQAAHGDGITQTLTKPAKPAAEGFLRGLLTKARDFVAATLGLGGLALAGVGVVALIVGWRKRDQIKTVLKTLV